MRPTFSLIWTALDLSLWKQCLWTADRTTGWQDRVKSCNRQMVEINNFPMSTEPSQNKTISHQGKESDGSLVQGSPSLRRTSQHTAPWSHGGLIHGGQISSVRHFTCYIIPASCRTWIQDSVTRYERCSRKT